MKSKYILGTVVGIMLLGIGTAVFAHSQMRGFGFGMHRGQGAFLAHLSRKLDLSQGQQDEVKQMWQAEKPAIVPLVQQLAQAHKQMVQAENGGNFDQAKVTAIANQQAQVLSQLIVEKEKLTAKFYAILTPEQRNKFDTMRERQLTHIDQFVQRMASNEPTTQAK
jgi:periplasmic protein CpxP/Spy